MGLFSQPDVSIEFGYNHERVKLRYNAIGEAYVRVYGSDFFLLPGGKVRNSFSKTWHPLTPDAGMIYGQDV